MNEKPQKWFLGKELILNWWDMGHICVNSISPDQRAELIAGLTFRTSYYAEGPMKQ